LPAIIFEPTPTNIGRARPQGHTRIPVQIARRNNIIRRIGPHRRSLDREADAVASLSGEMAVGIAGHCYYWPRGWRPFHQTILKLPTRLNRSPDRDTHTSEIGRLDGQSRESSNRRPFAHTVACIANSALTASTADLRARGSGRGARVDRKPPDQHGRPQARSPLVRGEGEDGLSTAQVPGEAFGLSSTCPGALD
jgi:hypothetical protein